MFLDDIMDRMSKLNASDLRDFPVRKLEKDETVITEMSELHHKIYTVGEQYNYEKRQLEATALRLQAQIMNEESDAIKTEQRITQELHAMHLAMNTLDDKVQAVIRIFWCVVHDDVDHLCPAEALGLAIAEGNKIVYQTKDRKPKIPDAIMKLFRLEDLP
jgi:hypothetical protein